MYRIIGNNLKDGILEVWLDVKLLIKLQKCKNYGIFWSNWELVDAQGKLKFRDKYVNLALQRVMQ